MPSPGGAVYRISTTATLACALKDFRIARGLTQDELADAVGAHRQYVSDLERAHFTEQVERILAMLHRLGVEMSLAMSDG